MVTDFSVMNYTADKAHSVAQAIAANNKISTSLQAILEQVKCHSALGKFSLEAVIAYDNTGMQVIRELSSRGYAIEHLKNLNDSDGVIGNPSAWKVSW